MCYNIIVINYNTNKIYRMYQELEYLQSFIDEMNQSSSGNHKLATIRKHSENDFLKKIFYYTYNHYMKYNVTSRNCKKKSDLLGYPNSYGSIFTLLDDLSNRVCTGHDAIANVNRFVSENITHKDLIFSIIDRDLRMGASITSILKIIPGIVPTFKVALANPYHPKRVDFESGEWLGSRKLDGVRCICRKEGDNVTFYSRNGKEFFTLGNLETEIRKIPGDIVLDGEVCLVDENNKEDFQGIMKQIRRKNHTIERPKFFIFDFIPIEEFDNNSGDTTLISRLRRGYDLLPESLNSDIVDALWQGHIRSEEQFTAMVKEAEAEGFEGIMLRKNVGYEGKRSHNLLKVKKFHDAEYVVIGCENGEMRWTENGQQITKEGLRNIVVEHKGCRVSVGSGFSKEQREFYLNRHDELLGKTVTIQYFEESQNQNGGHSLRFPVVKHIYPNGRTV